MQRIKDQAEERRKKTEERARKKEEEDKWKEERRIERERKHQEKEMRNPRKRLYSGANLIDDEGPSTSGTSTSGTSTSEPRPKHAVSENVPWCGLCGTREDSSDAEENWIQCSNCDSWCEEYCAAVFIDEVKDLEWFCPMCV